LPAGDYEPCRDEFERRFVDMPGSTTRRDIYQGFREHRKELMAALVPMNSTCLINGSYTTAKLDPGDIDMVIEVDAGLYYGSARVRELLAGHDVRGEFRCDAFPIEVHPLGHPNHHSVTEAARAYWRKWFGQDRKKRSKGRVWATLRAFR
jgi:hypothetical protein